MTSKPIWAVVLLALAAAAIAFVTTFLNGCSVAVHGQLVGWGAVVGKEPPEVPEWGTRLANNKDKKPGQPDESVPE